MRTDNESEIELTLEDDAAVSNRAFTEVYMVVGVVEVVMDERRYRIDILKNYKGAAYFFTTRCFREEAITVDGETERYFATYHTGGTAGTYGDTAGEALQSAMDALENG